MHRLTQCIDTVCSQCLYIRPAVCIDTVNSVTPRNLTEILRLTVQEYALVPVIGVIVRDYVCVYGVFRFG